MEILKMKYNELESILNKSNLKTRVLDWATDLAISKIKTHFGIVMKSSSFNNIRTIIEVLQFLDKNLEKRITRTATEMPIIEGSYIIRVKKYNAFIYVSGEWAEGSDKYTMTLYVFGKGTYRLAKYIDYKITRIEGREGTLTNFAVTANKRGDSQYWNCIANPIPPRTFDTLFFDGNVIESIKDHLNTWISNADIYKSRNLNFKTGILIHGPAGTGKSSLAVAIATYLKCNLISIDMSTFDDLDITDLTGAINADTANYVIFLDEIDVVFKSRDENITDAQRERTAKLLTFLDSANSPSNVVFVATTNYPERLDSAVTRKGRFDLTVHVDNFSKDTAEKMCKGFDTSLDNIKVEALENGKYNPASLQSAILNSISHNE